MDPLKISAQFAAYVWFSERGKGQAAAPGEAARFAKDNWVAFLPCADKGIGRLLIQIAKPADNARRRSSWPSATRRKRVWSRKLAGVD